MNKKMREIMMLHRCLTLGARFVAPDALLGMYTIQEMAEVHNIPHEVDEEGKVTILE